MIRQPEEPPLASAPEEAWRRPSPLLPQMRTAEWALVVVPALAGLAVIVTILAGALAGAVAVLASGGVAGGVRVFLSRRGRAWGYLERADDLLVRRGVLVRRLSVIPYGRMQFVDVTAGPIERHYGLATVRMHTAAAASDARIPGLPAAEAERLRDRLAALGETRAAGL